MNAGLFLFRFLLALLLLLGFYPVPVEGLLLAFGLANLYRFQGPYNGGNARMSLLLLVC